MLQLELRGEEVMLMPEKALWWPKEKILVVSDLHWGKSGHFRKHGIAVPLQSQSADEMRLAKLLRSTGAERLIIAGDLFHSRTNNQVASFVHFREQHADIRFDLVIGNHDILKETEYEGYHLEQHQDCLTIGPFCFAHDMTRSEQFVVHGHVHPAVRIKARGSNQPTLKLCCFAMQEDRLILPAFGEFTGTHILEPKEFLHLYLIAEDKVIQWK
jgi:DNA ligase-associated metallophosphoesterase